MHKSPISMFFTRGPWRWNCGSSDGLFILLLFLHTSNFWMQRQSLWTVCDSGLGGGWGGCRGVTVLSMRSCFYFYQVNYSCWLSPIMIYASIGMLKKHCPYLDEERGFQSSAFVQTGGAGRSSQSKLLNLFLVLILTLNLTYQMYNSWK